MDFSTVNGGLMIKCIILESGVMGLERLNRILMIGLLRLLFFKDNLLIPDVDNHHLRKYTSD